MSINDIRHVGYRVINCNSVVKSLIAKCVICRHLKESICQKKKAEFAREKPFQKPPFTYCGIDMIRKVAKK